MPPRSLAAQRRGSPQLPADATWHVPPQVLPLGDKKTQKVAVGDLTGVLQCVSVKKGDIAVAFKTLPTQAKAGAAAALGGGGQAGVRMHAVRPRRCSAAQWRGARLGQMLRSPL